MVAAGAGHFDQGLTPGVGFQWAECCHPVPGDRIVACANRVKVWRSTRSIVLNWPAESILTGSIYPGGRNRKAPWGGFVHVV